MGDSCASFIRGRSGPAANLLREHSGLSAWLSGFSDERKARLRVDVYDIPQFYLTMSILREHGIRVRHWHFLTGKLSPPRGGALPSGGGREGLPGRRSRASCPTASACPGGPPLPRTRGPGIAAVRTAVGDGTRIRPRGRPGRARAGPHGLRPRSHAGAASFRGLRAPRVRDSPAEDVGSASAGGGLRADGGERGDGGQRVAPAAEGPGGGGCGARAALRPAGGGSEAGDSARSRGSAPGRLPWAASPMQAREGAEPSAGGGNGRSPRGGEGRSGGRPSRAGAGQGGNGSRINLRIALPETIRREVRSGREAAPALEALFGIVLHYLGELQGSLDAGGTPSLQIDSFAERLRHAFRAPPPITEGERRIARDLALKFALLPHLGEDDFRPDPLALRSAASGPDAALVIEPNRLNDVVGGGRRHLEPRGRGGRRGGISPQKAGRRTAGRGGGRPAAGETTRGATAKHVAAGSGSTTGGTARSPGHGRAALALNAYPGIWKGLEIRVEPWSVLLMPPRGPRARAHALARGGLHDAQAGRRHRRLRLRHHGPGGRIADPGRRQPGTAGRGGPCSPSIGSRRSDRAAGWSRSTRPSRRGCCCSGPAGGSWRCAPHEARRGCGRGAGGADRGHRAPHPTAAPFGAHRYGHRRPRHPPRSGRACPHRGRARPRRHRVPRVRPRAPAAPRPSVETGDPRAVPHRPMRGAADRFRALREVAPGRGRTGRPPWASRPHRVRARFHPPALPPAIASRGC